MNSLIADWFIFNGRIFLSMISLLIGEMIVLRSMYICNWSVMAMKDDNLYSLIILRTNILLTGLITLQATVLDDGSCNSIHKSVMDKLYNDPRIPSEICINSLKM